MSEEPPEDLLPFFTQLPTCCRSTPAVPHATMSSGWLDDQPAIITDRMEIRPAAELGPIILCLDTSGSMSVSVGRVLGSVECGQGAMERRSHHGCLPP